MDIPVFQKNPFGSIPSNDSLDEVFEENNNNRKESVISFETTKGNLSNKELSLGCLKYSGIDRWRLGPNVSATPIGQMGLKMG